MSSVAAVKFHYISCYIIEWLEEELTKNAGVDKECTGALEYEAEAADSYAFKTRAMSD